MGELSAKTFEQAFAQRATGYRRKAKEKSFSYLTTLPTFLSRKRAREESRKTERMELDKNVDSGTSLEEEQHASLANTLGTARHKMEMTFICSEHSFVRLGRTTKPRGADNGPSPPTLIKKHTSGALKRVLFLELPRTSFYGAVSTGMTPASVSR